MDKFIIKYRWVIIVLCILTGAGSCLLIPLSRTDPDIRNYVPSTMPSKTATSKIENEFGVQDMIVVLFSDSCILTPSNLEQIRDIDKSLARLDGIASRISPFSIRTIKDEDGAMVAERLIRNIPQDSAGIRKLAGDILADRFARDIVVSSDMTSAAITATINYNRPEKETIGRIDSIIGIHKGRMSIITGGLPYIRKHILSDVRKDGLVLVPLALLIMVTILKVTLGEWRSVLMPFSVVLISTAISLGMIPLLGWKISIISLLIPVILVAVANNYGIYLTARYQEISFRQPGITRDEIVAELLRSLNMPVLFSGLTTIAGILGLLTHSIIPARQVGVLAATGVTFALIMSLLLIPSFIWIRGPLPVIKSGKRIKTGIFDHLIARLTGMIVRYPGKILIVSAVITILMSLGAFFLRIETNQENYFPGNHPVRQASNIINRKFGGSQTVSVMLTGNIRDPEVMKGIDNLTRKLEKLKGVGNVFSISQAVREMTKAVFTRDEEGYDRIPDSEAGIAQLFELYNMSGNPDDFKQLMNLDYTRAHIIVRLSDPGKETISLVTKTISELTSGIPAQTTVGGYAIIMAEFAGSIIKGQISSLIFALATVFILLAIIFRSVRGGLVGSIPLAASILILFGFMGMTGIVLDAATALLSSVMIGVGVDFTIQYVWCYKTQYNKGLSWEDATREALGTIGRSIIINAVSVMAGFSALLFSGFTSIRFFGFLVIISIGSCLIGAVVFIPAYILKFRPGFIQKDLLKTKNQEYEKKIRVVAATDASLSRAGTTT